VWFIVLVVLPFRGDAVVVVGVLCAASELGAGRGLATVVTDWAAELRAEREL